MTANTQARTQPLLPTGFLGNIIFCASAVATAGDISLNTLEFGADKIDKATCKLDDAYVRSVVDYMESVEDVNGL